MLFVEYPKCSTCQKAKRYLEERSAAFEDRPIHTQPPTVEELRAWQAKSGLPLERLFNTSGRSYQALGLKDRLPDLTEEEQLTLLVGDGMLVKRPILVTEDAVLVGFRQAEWDALLSK